MHIINHHLRDAFLFGMFVLLLSLPSVGYGQAENADLRATIRAELLSDPRTSGLSSAELDAIVDLLTEEAGKQGMTVQDIQWRPQNTNQFAPSGNAAPAAVECEGGFLCLMSEAFGFIGGDATIPFTLGAASMGLVWITAEMIHRRRYPVRPNPVSTP